MTSRSGPRNLREAGYRAEVERAGLKPRIVTVPFDTPIPQRFALVQGSLDEARAQAPIDGVFATDAWPPPKSSSGRAPAACPYPAICPSSASTALKQCAVPCLT